MRSVALAICLAPSAALSATTTACDLQGIVTQTPVIAQTEGDAPAAPVFTYRVAEATASDGAPHGESPCARLQGTTLEVTLSLGTSMPVAGDRLALRLLRIALDERPAVQIFSLTPPDPR